MNRATAMIGDVMVYGMIEIKDNQVCFSGSLYQYKDPIHDVIQVLLDRLKNEERLSIEGYDVEGKWNSIENKLISYSIKGNVYKRKTILSFTLALGE